MRRHTVPNAALAWCLDFDGYKNVENNHRRYGGNHSYVPAPTSETRSAGAAKDRGTRTEDADGLDLLYGALGRLRTVRGDADALSK